jgi:predicted ABC-type ATPase
MESLRQNNPHVRKLRSHGFDGLSGFEFVKSVVVFKNCEAGHATIFAPVWAVLPPIAHHPCPPNSNQSVWFSDQSGRACYHRPVKKPRKRAPRCIIIAGPNGAGKTTFAQEFLPNYAKVVHFVNTDLIAGGLSPLSPETAAIAAGRLFLKELDRLAARRADFAFESTLSGLGYVARLKRWKKAGYRIEIIYLNLNSTRIALRRIAARVQQGGHGIPKADAVRRFRRSWSNFKRIYQPIADAWMIYNNSGGKAILIEEGP